MKPALRKMFSCSFCHKKFSHHASMKVIPFPFLSHSLSSYMRRCIWEVGPTTVTCVRSSSPLSFILTFSYSLSLPSSLSHTHTLSRYMRRCIWEVGPTTATCVRPSSPTSLNSTRTNANTRLTGIHTLVYCISQCRVIIKA